MNGISIFWFRRDLRLEDNAALHVALSGQYPVQPIFIFDQEILEKLNDASDARVTYIYQELERLHSELRARGATLDVRIGKPIDVWQQLLDQHEVKEVYFNRDYEPYARQRDKEIYELLTGKGINVTSKKDHVILEKSEVVKDDGKPYTVFTPYSRKWKSVLQDHHLSSFPSEERNHWHSTTEVPLPTLEQVGFKKSKIPLPSRVVDHTLIGHYDETRDIPGIAGTSRLGLHLRFGTVSIRRLAKLAGELNQTYLNELIWREFYQMILWHFPQVVDRSFKPQYDRISWRNDQEEFRKWCEGSTGFPIVDAGMRELNTTGFMHNRVRMITASFLCKDLLIDWRWGEAYFAEKLLDFELASNNGGWQWAAGTGCDAAPYFRVFNPASQQKKFDPKGIYIKKWVPEYETDQYKGPMVDHAMARIRALETYKSALQQESL